MSIEQFIKKGISQKAFFLFRSPGESSLQMFLPSDEMQSHFEIRQVSFLKDNKKHYRWRADKSVYDLKNLHSVKENAKYLSPLDEQKLRQKHLKLVKLAVNAMDKDFKKVVLSSKFTYPIRLNRLSSFLLMMQKYPDAHVYWTKVDGKEWMGASPELLLSEKENRFKTVSLAGTQVWSEDIKWSDKEKDEQAYVTDFLEDQLSRLDLKLDIKGPVTARAGGLAHLKTEISGSLDNNLELDTVLEKIHPTPAVCGLPKDRALDFILEHEGYSRSLYTGYMGVESLAKSNSKGVFFVNLRCMEILEDHVNVFVGGGITKDSIPEKEWDEICNKSRTMVSVLVPED